MPIISLKCPGCGAELQVNDSLEKMYCNFCGNMCVLSEALAQRQVIDESHKVKPFLDLAESSLAAKDFVKCAEYADKALEIDNENAYAWYLKGCGAEGMKEGSGETFFLKAKSYCNDDDLNEKIDRAIDCPESVVTRPAKKLKIDASGTDKKLMKDKFAVFIDKEKVAVIKGGDITNVTLPLGKHEIAVRANSQMTKAFKRTVSVEENNYKLKIFGGKDKDFIFDLDEI